MTHLEMEKRSKPGFKMRVISCCLLFFLSYLSYCQNNANDSLLTLLKADKEDTLKITHLNILCNNFRLTGDYKTGLSYGNEALILSKKISFKKGEANSFTNIGMIHYYLGNYSEALVNYFKALQIREIIGDKKGISVSRNNIGITYDSQGNYEESLKNYFICLKLRIETGDKQAIAASYNNIAVTYMNQAEAQFRGGVNYDSVKSKLSTALRIFQTSLKLKEELNDRRGIASTCNNLGLVNTKMARLLSMQKGDRDSVRALLSRAVKSYSVPVTIWTELDDKEGLATMFVNLGEAYTLMNDPVKAHSFLDKALALGKQIRSKDDIKSAYEVLVCLDSTERDFKSAFEHQKLYTLYRDSLVNEESRKKSMESAMTYEFEKKELAARAEQEKLDAISTEEKKKQKIIIYAVAGVLMIVLIFSLFLFNRFRITQKQKKTIESQKLLVDQAYDSLHEKNKEVMDSIRYAHRIQRALITSEKYIERILKKNLDQ